MKYNQVCESRHASFTPLCRTVDRMLGAEFNSLKHLGDGLFVNWDNSYSATMYWMKCKLSFAYISATNYASVGGAPEAYGSRFVCVYQSEEL